MFCFTFLFETGNYMEGSKKVESIFLSQLEDLLSGPDFDMCPLAEKPAQPSSHLAAVQWPCRQADFNEPPAVASLKSCWRSPWQPPAEASLLLASPNQLPCEMQIQTVWKLVKKNSGWGCRYVKYSCASWKKGDSMNDTTKDGPWHSRGHFALLFTPYCISGLEFWSWFCEMPYLYAVPKIVIKNG